MRRNLVILLFLFLLNDVFAYENSVYAEAEKFAKANDYTQAINLIENRVPKEARDYKFYYWRGSFLFNKDTEKNRRKALNDLLIAYPMFENDLYINSILGLIYSLINDADNSVKYLSKAFYLSKEQKSKDVIIPILIHQCHNIHQYEKVINFESEYPNESLFLFYGMAHDRLGNKEKSKYYLEKAITSSSFSTHDKMIYTDFLFLSKDFSKAEEVIQEISREKDAYEVSLVYQSYLHMTRDEMRKAKKCLDTVLKKYNGNETAWKFSTYYWYLKNNRVKAVHAYGMYIMISQDLDRLHVTSDDTDIDNFLSADELFQTLQSVRTGK